MKKSELEMSQLLWKPSSEKIKKTSIYKFIQHVNSIYKIKIENFMSLHEWSIQNREDFWEEIWDFFEVVGSKGDKPYLYPENDF